MAAPRHIQMRGELQRVQADAVHDHRKDIQDHVQAVAKHQKHDGKNHKQELAKQLTPHLRKGLAKLCTVPAP